MSDQLLKEFKLKELQPVKGHQQTTKDTKTEFMLKRTLKTTHSVTSDMLKRIENQSQIQTNPLRKRKSDTKTTDKVAPQPPELEDLSPLERRLISKRYPFMKLIALPKGQQSGIKGTVLKENNVFNKNVQECHEWEKKCEREDEETWTDLTKNSEIQTIDEDDTKKCEKTSISIDQMENDCDLQTELTVQGNEKPHNYEDNNLDKTDFDDSLNKVSDSESEDDYTEDPVSRLRGVKFDTCIQVSDPAIDADKIISIAPGEGKRPINLMIDDN
ncbi:unnamed protein product [Mytilus coruscus]|uniref:Uncharacterized protein n=1 Tax=Mytilus coruscus TaxID=42192 RepID=A0A6J8B3A0_MYTCO|nr:unnamed protein product [Mytilus coruscus]